MRSPSRNAHRHSYSIQKVFVTVGLTLLGLEFLLFHVGLLALEGETPKSAAYSTLELDGQSERLQLEQQQQQVRRRRRDLPRGPPDGTFNGFPVHLQHVNQSKTIPYSLLHCIGENYQKGENWMHRSCHFTFFCFNIDSKEFSIYSRPEDRSIQKWARQLPLMDISQSFIQEESTTTTSTSTSTSTVSLGGINRKWGNEGVARLEWFPKILSEPPTHFYALPEEVVLIPFHSLAGWNPGHLVWDDYLPIFTLMSLFQLNPQSQQQQDQRDFIPLALRYVLPGEGLWASCDTPNKHEDCAMMQHKFWPLMHNHSQLTTQLDAKLKLKLKLSLANANANENNDKNKNKVPQQPQSNLVCAKNGLAGIGALTDHGTRKLHGWHKEDYETTHNHGRGGLFWKFRNFCLGNLGISDPPITNSALEHQPPYNIVFSMQSSSNPLRNLDFTNQELLLKRKLDPSDAIVSSYMLKTLTLQEQVKLATETSIFITGCGGGAVTATFLPRGATVIIFYNEVGGRVSNTPTNLPARLDWDLFNNLSYLHVHWLPSGTMKTLEDMNIFIQVVRDDLKRRKSEPVESSSNTS